MLTNRSRNPRRKGGAVWIAAAVCLLLMGTFEVWAARQPRGQRDATESRDEFAAARLLKTGQDLLLAREEERGVEVMKKIIDQFPESDVRFQAYLALGKHFIDQNKQQEAIGYLNFLRELESGERQLSGEMLNVLLEGLFLTGKAYFQMRQYTSAFPVLRKITNDYPNTIWANEAYYYIGMSHFGQENWNKAIEALSKVGTYVDPESPTIEYVEAGQRFYVKVADGDLPVQFRLGTEVHVTVTSASGDSESMVCIPLGGESEVFIGSIATAIGAPTKNNEVLEVIGGDQLTVTYTDRNAKDGSKDVARQGKVLVVSTASLAFTRGDLETRADGAFLGQPIYLVLRDTDLDKGVQADQTTLRLISRFKPEAAEDAAPAGKEFDLASFLRDSSEADQYQLRDEVTITLTEEGAAPVRSGIFAGKCEVVALADDRAVDKNDRVLSCGVGDEIVAVYTDELHINGDTPREVQAVAKVLSEIDASPKATQYVVNDPIIRSKKNLVEATAFLELGRIFRSMGLKAGAREKCDEGLALVNSIIRSNEAIPRSYKEEAFRLKWELEIAQDEYGAAIATCRLFNRLYPNSPLVDQALLGIAQVKLEKELHQEAISIYKQILALPHSQVKAQAQFRIAEAMEASAKKTGRKSASGFNDEAIAQYKVVAERYPDSEFAGPALGKLVDYYIETKDYARADDLLEQVFTDHPDAPFLDSMLLKWVLVSFRMGDFRKAHEKCTQLIFEYPTSDFAEKAKKILPQIEAKIK